MMEAMDSGSPVSARSKSALSPSDNIARRAARNSRVHFDEDGYIPQLQEANPIQIQVTGEERSKTIGVYLGFLQEEHKYDVKFEIPEEMCHGYFQIGGPPLELFEEGDFCKVTCPSWDKKPGHLEVHMIVTVPSTNVQHVLDDKFCLRSPTVKDRFVRVNVSAKIMGKTMGTPTLKDGIKCIGLCPDPQDSNSDSSDNEAVEDGKNVPMKDVKSHESPAH